MIKPNSSASFCNSHFQATGRFAVRSPAVPTSIKSRLASDRAGGRPEATERMRRYRKRCRLMRCANHDKAHIAVDVIESVGDRYARGVFAEIMVQHLAGLRRQQRPGFLTKLPTISRFSHPR